MAKSSKSGRSSGSSSTPKSIYGSTPAARLGNNSSQRIGPKISGCNPNAHKIGTPREK